MRKLAQRAAAASREIKGLIGDSVERVEGMVTDAQKQLLTHEHILDLVASLTKDLEIIPTLATDDPIVELLMALHEQAKNEES